MPARLFPLNRTEIQKGFCILLVPRPFFRTASTLPSRKPSSTQAAVEYKLIDPSEKSARTWATLCHIGGLAGCFLPWLAHLAVPLLVWLFKRNDHPLIDEQGKESLNFQLSLTLYSVLGCILLAVTVVGLFAIPFFLCFLYVLNIFGVVLAAIQASDGKHFRYWLIIRFVK